MADNFILSELDGSDPVTIYITDLDDGRWQNRGSRLAPGVDGGSRYDEGAVHPSGRQPVVSGNVRDADIYTFFSRYMSTRSFLLEGFGDADAGIEPEQWRVRFNTQASSIGDARERGDPDDADERAELLHPCQLVFFLDEQVGPLQLVAEPGPYYPGRRLSLRVLVGGVEQDWDDFTMEHDQASDSALCIPEESGGYVDLGLPGVTVTLTVYRKSDNAQVQIQVPVEQPYSNFGAIREDAPSCVLHPITPGNPGQVFPGYTTRFAFGGLGLSDGSPAPPGTPVTLELQDEDGVTVPDAAWSCDGVTFGTNPDACATGDNGWLQPVLDMPIAAVPPGNYQVAVTPDGGPTQIFQVIVGRIISAALTVASSMTSTAGPWPAATITDVVYEFTTDDGGRIGYPDGATPFRIKDSREGSDISAYHYIFDVGSGGQPLATIACHPPMASDSCSFEIGVNGGVVGTYAGQLLLLQWHELLGDMDTLDTRDIDPITIA